jgi:hypothetical protein
MFEKFKSVLVSVDELALGFTVDQVESGAVKAVAATSSSMSTSATSDMVNHLVDSEAEKRLLSRNDVVVTDMIDHRKAHGLAVNELISES